MCCVLFAVGGLLCVVCCVLFVVWCLLFVVCPNNRHNQHNQHITSTIAAIQFCSAIANQPFQKTSRVPRHGPWLRISNKQHTNNTHQITNNNEQQPTPTNNNRQQPTTTSTHNNQQQPAPTTNNQQQPTTTNTNNHQHQQAQPTITTASNKKQATSTNYP